MVPFQRISWERNHGSEGSENAADGHAPEVDFDAEGLLDDIEGDVREPRLTLLRELARTASRWKLREAVSAGRLALLPVERALAWPGRRNLVGGGGDTVPHGALHHGLRPGTS